VVKDPDIKPANILVSRPIGTSEFDVTFKLADFGLTNFSIVKNGEHSESVDAHSTQMYSRFHGIVGEECTLTSLSRSRIFAT